LTKKSLTTALCSSAAIALFAPLNVAAAQESEAETPETEAKETVDSERYVYDDTIVVYGRGERRIGIAGAASEGGVAGADIEIRPLLRPGELLEATPGLIATQHSGGGKANQFFLRGFNLDHGTDFSLYIDDMPMNFRTHGHGQGYLDVNGLIPETVERVDYRKGPYRADRGDFSFVGSASITTRDKIDPFVTVEGGSYNYWRFVGGGTVPLSGDASLTVVGQAKFYDGPWELPEDLDAYAGFAKFHSPLGETGELQVSLNLYSATWAPTEQLPERVVGTPLCADRFCSLDKTLRGKADRQILTVNYHDEDWRITGWAQHNDWSLLNNFTFLLDDPVNGDQRRQFEERWSWGGRIERNFEFSDTFSLSVGTELREDTLAPVGLDHTIEGMIDFTYGSFDVKETSASLYAEATWTPIERLMVIGGIRNDWYRFRTEAVEGATSWSGVVKDDSFAPKIGVNYEVADGLALYANYGEGFHSNDARGVTNPDDPAPGLVEGDMEEVGFRVEKGGLIFTGVYWWSSIESELIYVGDSGAVEPSDPGVRHGYELTAFWKPNSWLAVDGVWTGSTARYAGLPEGENYVPGALESSGELGISALFKGWNAAARMRYLGPHPLIEDNSERGEPTLLVNFRAAWTPSFIDGFELYGEVLNVFDSEDDDIDYFYATRFPGEPADGIEGRNSRIVEPRQFRIGVKKSF
jgi:outer membrane receptor protein involved in Fe transport